MPEKVSTSASGNIEILRGVEIDERVRLNRPDITIKEKDPKNGILWILWMRVVMKENEKVDNI